MTRRAIVAGSVKHAMAMLHWENQNPKHWDILTYGDAVNFFYQTAALVRPLEGITEDHTKWVLETLRPRVVGLITTLTRDWGIEAAPDKADGPQLAQPDYYLT